jgi:hypothetical protein
MESRQGERRREERDRIKNGAAPANIATADPQAAIVVRRGVVRQQ